MNIFHLPPPLRRCIFAASSRALTTQAHHTPIHQDVAFTPPPPSNPPDLLTLSSTTLNQYQVSLPPDLTQLKYAHAFFTAAPPFLLYSASTLSSLPSQSPHPEVAFLGRSNVGKSSLLNALFGRPRLRDARVSSKPGRTRTMNGFGITSGLPLGAAPKEGAEKQGAWKRFPRGGLVVMDMPGYGSGSRETWGREVMKYLEKRKQLRKTFVLVDAEHGLKQSDLQILTHLRQEGVPHQVVLSKVDKILYPRAKMPGPVGVSQRLGRLREVCEGIVERLDRESGMERGELRDVLCCSAEKGLDAHNTHRKLGVDEVRWAILSACGLECDEQGRKKKLWVPEIQGVNEEK